MAAHPPRTTTGTERGIRRAGRDALTDSSGRRAAASYIALRESLELTEPRALTVVCHYTSREPSLGRHTGYVPAKHASTLRGIAALCRDFPRLSAPPVATTAMRAFDRRNKISQVQDNRLQIGLLSLRIPKSETAWVKITVITVWALRPVIFGLAMALASGC